MQALMRADLSKYRGKFMKVSQLYQEFNGLVTIDELKSLKEFLSAHKYSDDSELQSDPDRLDMDDLLEALKLHHTQ
jgi:hypothetical protein